MGFSDSGTSRDDVSDVRTGGTFASANLIRPRDGKTLAGVCAAIARGTGTDPLLWRVLLAVLAAFGGVGIVVYLFGWLFFPGEGDDASAAESLFGKGSSRTSKLAAAALVFGGSLVTIFVVIVGAGRPLITIGLFGLAMVWLSRQAVAAPTSAPPAPVGTKEAFAPHGPFAPGRVRMAGGGPAAPTVPIPDDVPDPTRELPMEAPGATREEPRTVWDSGRRPHPVAPTRPVPVVHASPAERAPRSTPMAAEPVRRRGPGRVTFVLLLLASAVLLILAATPVDVPLTLFVSVLLGICGLGLIAGSRRGRSRGLTWLASLLAVILAAAMVVDRLDGYGYRSITVHTVADVPAAVDASLGLTRLDLSTVEFSDGDEVRLTASVHMGEVSIRVPENVDVIIEVDDVATGSVQLDQDTVGGVGGEPTLRSDGADGPGGGLLTVEATVAFGSLEVNR